MVEMSQKLDHEKVIRDAEDKRKELNDDIERKKKKAKQFDIRYNGTSLKHKLNIDINPMYENLKNVLDPKYANTSDYDSYFVSED